MTHAEALYLLHRAHVAQRYHRKAEAEGTVFHAVNTYVPLASGFEAACDILRVNDTDAGDHTILRLRHRPNVPCDGAKGEAAAFFDVAPEGFTTEDPGGCLHVYAVPSTLKAVTFDDDPDLASPPDAPEPGGSPTDR